MRKLLHIASCAFLVLVPLSLAGTPPPANGSFKWLDRGSSPELWGEIESAFQTELAPDPPDPNNSELDTFRYKYLEKVGRLKDSVLVILGHRPNKQIRRGQEWDQFSSAFSYNLVTHSKTAVEHAGYMWKWRYRRLAIFSKTLTPDVTFTYLSCTECEPELVFASLYYDRAKSTWRVRSWGDGKDVWWAGSDGLVVDMDLSASDTIAFDCIYGVLKSPPSGTDELGIRCKAVSHLDNAKVKIEDVTLVYFVSANGHFGRKRITDFSEIAELNFKLCRMNSFGRLCKLPAYLTLNTVEHSEIERMFPNAGKACRDLKDFSILKRGALMSEVAHRCGVPDEVGGSGISIFVYYLDDGSLIAIGAANAGDPILYATHADRNGTASDLVPIGKK